MNLRSFANSGRASSQKQCAERKRWRGPRLLLTPTIAIAGLAAAGGLIAAGLAARADGPPVSSVENFGWAPAYRLIDQNGHPVRSAQFDGKVQVVSFLFPYCTSYCPILARDMAELANTVNAGSLRGKVQIVSFNVDPAGAGPAQLRKFIAQYGGAANNGTWEYLTGTSAQIRSVVSGGFHLYFNKTSIAAERRDIARQKAAGTYTPQPRQSNALAAHAHVDYDIVHNDDLEIISPHGQIVALFDQASSLTQAHLLDAIREALADENIAPQRVTR